MDGPRAILIRQPLSGFIPARLWCFRAHEPVEFVREYR